MSDTRMRSPSFQPGMPRPHTTGRFYLLDGLRGVAAFAVILDHVPSGMLGDLVSGRALSVDFFFVLSGFVLAHAYGDKLEDGWSPWAFMRARLIRLYPLYLAGSLLGLVMVALGTWKGWQNAASLPELFTFGVLALVFLPQPPIFSYGDGPLYPANGPAWSLFFELIANLLYALLARFLSLRLLAVTLPIVAALFALSILNHSDVREPGWRWAHFDAGLARVIFGFFAGVAIYKLRARMRWPSIPWWVAVAFFLGVIAMPVSSRWAPAYDAFAAIILMPLLVGLASGSAVSGNVARTCAIFGFLSYGVYITHVPIYQAFQVVLGLLKIELPHIVFAPVIVGLLAAATTAIAGRLYDEPFRAWLSQLLPGRAKREKSHASLRERA